MVARHDRSHVTDDGPVDDGYAGDRRSDDDHADDARLERGRRVWDQWSDRYAFSERDFEPVRTDAIEHLGLSSGDRVLDVGCGPGVSFDRLRESVGAEGEVVGVDYSPQMVERARERVDERGWTNVRVKRGDAATADFGDGFDAAIATLSLSVVPDAERAVGNVRTSLRAGGTFVVFDLRPVPRGPLRVVNPLLRRVLYWIANWNRETDLVGVLEAAFPEFEVVDTYAGGVGFTAVATADDCGGP